MTRTFLVKADVGKAPVKLGQTATVRVELPQTAGVTKLPLTALKEEQGRSIVWLVDRQSMTVRAQAVAGGRRRRQRRRDHRRAAAGQVVVTAGVHVLNPGQTVKFYVEPGAAQRHRRPAPRR